MRARRIRFAAPFVIVTTASCGQPAPATLPTESPIVATSADAGVPIVDATLIDAERAAIYVTIAIPAHTIEPKEGEYVSCHNFGPHYRGCNPPRPVHYEAKNVIRKILDASANGDGSLVLVEQTDNAVIEAGMAVTAQTMSMNTRSTVGYVREASEKTATLALRLSLDEVQHGADLVIDVTFDADEATLDSVDAHILDVEISGPYTAIVVGAGTKDGVDRGWRLDVIDDEGHPVPNGKGTVVKVTARTSVAKIKLTPELAKRFARVRLSPPTP